MSSVELAAGWLAGGVGVGLTHPLDTVRTRMQRKAMVGKVKTSYLAAIKGVYRKYGAGGYFRGVLPPVFFRGFEVGINRVCYAHAEKWCKRNSSIPFVKEYNVEITGMFAGFGCSFVGQPILMAKNKAQTLAGANYKESFRSYMDMFLQIQRTEGMRGFMKGLTPNLFFYTLSFGQFYHYYDIVENKWGWGPAAAGLMGGAASWPIFYPMEVIRTVAHTTNMTSKEACQQMFKKVMKKPNNIGNIMWPALGMTMVRAVPRWGVTFQIHAWCMHYFNEGKNHEE